MGKSTSNDAVLYESTGGVAVVTINRADRMNRLDTEIVEGLHQAWRRFMATDGDRVAVVTGAGEKAFSAGADLKNVPHNLYHGMPGIGVPVDKPIIAATAGWVIGGGMVLTTMCDLIIAADNTKFSYPEIKIGFSGGLISNIVTRIPHKVAMELLLMCETMEVKRAYEVGYVNRIVPYAELMPTAMTWARQIAAMAPLPTRMLKRFTSEALAKSPTEIAGIARAQVDLINVSEDWVEGRKAFVEKRAPKYKGK